MSYISRAQNFEDYRLFRAFQNVSDGRYIDIGAWDPTYHSVSHNFYIRGWRGINAEPASESFTKLQSFRHLDINIQKFVTNKSSQIRFFVVPNSGLSTSSEKNIELIKQTHSTEVIEELVETISLNEIFNLLPRQTIQWLKIDVEGAEYEVLQSWGDNSTRPLVVVVEATVPSTPQLSDQNWEIELTSRGYLKAYFDGLNNFYCLEDLKEIQESIASPISIFDDVVKYEDSLNREIIENLANIDPNLKIFEDHKFLGESYVTSVIKNITQILDQQEPMFTKISELAQEIQSLKNENRRQEQVIANLENPKIFRYSLTLRRFWHQHCRFEAKKYLVRVIERVAAWIMRRKKLKAIVFKVIPIRMLFRLKTVIKNQHKITNLREKNDSHHIDDPKLGNLLRLLEVNIK